MNECNCDHCNARHVVEAELLADARMWAAEAKKAQVERDVAAKNRDAWNNHANRSDAALRVAVQALVEAGHGCDCPQEEKLLLLWEQHDRDCVRFVCSQALAAIRAARSASAGQEAASSPREGMEPKSDPGIATP